MSAKRAGIFDDEAPLGDLSEFAPQPKREARPRADREAVRQVSEQHGFPSREKPKAPAPETVEKQHRPGRPRTDRTAQLNLKVRPATHERFLRLAREHDVLQGDLLDLAMDALEGMARRSK
jgi:hypothetical protein